MNACEKAERDILMKITDEASLTYCDINKCLGFCCYDGAYLAEGEEQVLKNRFLI